MSCSREFNTRHANNVYQRDVKSQHERVPDAEGEAHAWCGAYPTEGHRFKIMVLADERLKQLLRRVVRVVVDRVDH